MRNLLSRIRQGLSPRRDMSLDDYATLVSQATWGNLAGAVQQTWSDSDRTERIAHSFPAYVQQAYQANGVVFACMLVRLTLFSEARFAYREIGERGPGDLRWGAGLETLQKPWSGATTGNLLAHMIQDADLAGNSYTLRLANDTLRRLRPDWTTIVMVSDQVPERPDLAPDADVYGYIFEPGGPGSGQRPIFYPTAEVAHFAPIPDPLAAFRGMSWLTPIVREIDADTKMTHHKEQFLNHGATPNMVVKFDPSIEEDRVKRFIALMKEDTEGVRNAWRTLYLGGGADATVVGKDLKQLDYKVVQSAGETRIAAAAGVHPTIAGLSEGLQGSSLNAGNFGAARRLLGDRTLRPLWRQAAGSLSNIIDAPPGTELWYDARDIPFLAEDMRDASEIQRSEAETIRTLTDAGYEPDSVIKAVLADDLSLLRHTGLFSVQLRPPGTGEQPPGPEEE